MKVAESITGGSLLPLLSLQPNVIGDVDDLEPDQAPQVIDSEAVIVTDLLATEPDDGFQTYIDSDVGLDNHNVQFIWKSLVSPLRSSYDILVEAIYRRISASTLDFSALSAIPLF